MSSRFINGDLVLDSSFYATTTVTLDNEFTGGERTLRLTRIGNVVTITQVGVPIHSSAASRSSSSGLIPAAYRPSADTRNIYGLDTGTPAILQVRISAAGVYQTNYMNSSFANVSLTSTLMRAQITYIVD